MINKIREWYNGKWTPYENPPDAAVFVIGGDMVYSPSAKIARAIVKCFRYSIRYIANHIWQILGAMGAIATVLSAYYHFSQTQNGNEQAPVQNASQPVATIEWQQTTLEPLDIRVATPSDQIKNEPNQ